MTDSPAPNAALPDDAPATAVSTTRPDVSPSLRGQGRLLALGITPRLRQSPVLDIVGQTIRDIHDLASLAQTVRDQQIETLRWIYVRGPAGAQQVVAVESISSRQPDAADLFLTEPGFDRFVRKNAQRYGRDVAEWPRNLQKEYLRRVEARATRGFADQRDRMRRLGATGFYLLHNHPSGQ